jgi:hypothetical protein
MTGPNTEASAALRLMSSSNLVGRSIGNSASPGAAQHPGNLTADASIEVGKVRAVGHKATTTVIAEYGAIMPTRSCATGQRS